MSPLKFQLYLHWFRILGVLRSAARDLPGWSGKVQSRVTILLRWCRSVVLSPLWISVEGYVALWEYLERRSVRIRPLRTWHRAVFCLGLSLLIGPVLSLAILGGGVNEVTFLLSGVHGMTIFLAWKRGVRWFRNLLGARPVRHVDPKRAYEGLDFGN